MRGNREQGVGNSVQKLKKLAAFGAMAATLVLAGCRQDMQDQPKFFPQRGTDFYADGRSVRPQVENTVARGQLRENAYFYTGLINGKEGEGMPFPATLEVLERGQERYNVYCTPCHSRVGNGVGMIVQRGYMKAGNFNTVRLETAVTGTPDNGLYVLPVPGAAPSANGEGSTSRSNANPAAGTPAGQRAPQQSGVPKQ